MQRYVAQLVEDLRDIARYLPAKLYLPNPYDFDVPDYILEWEQAPHVMMSELLGLEAHAFPPAHRLTEAQQAALSDAILAVWEAFNLIAALPEALPAARRYALLTERWGGDPVQHLHESRTHLSFCDHDPARCPFEATGCRCATRLADERATAPQRQTRRANPDGDQVAG